MEGNDADYDGRRRAESGLLSIKKPAEQQRRVHWCQLSAVHREVIIVEWDFTAHLAGRSNSFELVSHREVSSCCRGSCTNLGTHVLAGSSPSAHCHGLNVGPTWSLGSRPRVLPTAASFVGWRIPDNTYRVFLDDT